MLYLLYMRKNDRVFCKVKAVRLHNYGQTEFYLECDNSFQTFTKLKLTEDSSLFEDEKFKGESLDVKFNLLARMIFHPTESLLLIRHLSGEIRIADLNYFF